MPDDQQPETDPNEEPTPAPGPVEQGPPDQPEAEAEPMPDVPDAEPEPIEIPVEEPAPVEASEEEPEPIDLPDDDREPEEWSDAEKLEAIPELIETVRDLRTREGSHDNDQREFGERLAELEAQRGEDFRERSEPPPDPHQMVGPVRIRGGDGISSIFGPTGGSFSADQPFMRPMPAPVGDIEWGIAALPANRPGDDSCAWMRPATDLHYGYCYVQPTAAPTSHIWTPPTIPEVSEEDQKGLVKVVFWGAGYARPSEPNVRGGDLVPFIRVGGIALGIGYLDYPIGRVVTGFNATLTAGGPPEGWVLMDDADTSRMPNTDVTTLGTEISNNNVQQTLLVAAGDQDWAGIPDDEEFPNVKAQGAIDVAFQRFVHAVNGDHGDYYNVYGSYYLVLQRVN